MKSLIKRSPVHPSITESQISNLVDDFYGCIKNEPRLGPIFLSRNKGEWSGHLETMKLFWSAVLLRTGSYKGQPVFVHNAIDELTTEDFSIWLDIFSQNAHRAFSLKAAPIVIEVATRIANSLWLSKFGEAGDNAPF